MLAATIDQDGCVRVHPESRASLRIVRDATGTITVTNVGDCPALLNGKGVTRHGSDRFYLAPGKSQRFPRREPVLV